MGGVTRGASVASHLGKANPLLFSSVLVEGNRTAFPALLLELAEALSRAAEGCAEESSTLGTDFPERAEAPRE